MFFFEASALITSYLFQQELVPVSDVLHRIWSDVAYG